MSAVSPLAAKLEAVQAAKPAPVNPQPLDFLTGWEAGEDVPRYVVDGLLAHGEVGIVSADTGAGKSWLGAALTVEVIHGARWLGRKVEPGRVLYVDEEQPRRVPLARLRSLGLEETDLPSLLYFSRQGLRVGDAGPNDTWLDRALEEFRPSLLVIDTATAATAVEDANSNDEVLALYRSLRPKAEKYDCAILLFHHVRKRQSGAGDAREQGHAMMGARHWANQADVHVALKRLGGSREQAGEVYQLRTDLKLTFPKVRDDVPLEEEFARIVSTKDAGTQRLIDARVETCDAPSAELESRIAEAIRAADGELTTAELAETVDADPRGKPFKDAVNAAIARGWLVRPQRGRYACGTNTDEPAI